jgi:hypothetical protein
MLTLPTNHVNKGSKMHKSRLGAVIVDCETDDLEREAKFWGAALGGEVTSPRPGGRYLDVRAGRHCGRENGTLDRDGGAEQASFLHNQRAP